MLQDLDNRARFLNSLLVSNVLINSFYRFKIRSKNKVEALISGHPPGS